VPVRAPLQLVDASPPWAGLIDAVLRDSDRIEVHFQPIVDLRRAVVAGFEVLARFRSDPYASPDQWFQAAAVLGRQAELEAATLARALDARRRLPPNCFLSLNVGPDALLDDRVAGTLREAGALGGVVVEITEQRAVDDYGALRARVDPLREAGAHLAVDDAGAGYASLSHVMALRPDFIKVDRGLVCDIDRDPTKAAMIETLGTFGSRIDAWMIAEGIERAGELRRLMQLEVPLGQGYRLGRPAPSMRPLDREVLELHHRIERGSEDGVGQLMEPATTTADPAAVGALFAGDDEIDVVVVLDAYERPIEVHLREPFRRRQSPPVAPLCVLPVARPGDVARRAMTREDDRRFMPVAITDDRGRFAGVVRIERLVEALAAATAA
jgi:EAL domain-containing protein (putative c-di-GMP-specific phosphodiesterase class I)